MRKCDEKESSKYQLDRLVGLIDYSIKKLIWNAQTELNIQFEPIHDW